MPWWFPLPIKYKRYPNNKKATALSKYGTTFMLYSGLWVGLEMASAIYNSIVKHIPFLWMLQDKLISFSIGIIILIIGYLMIDKAKEIAEG